MARANKKGRSKTRGPFILITHDLMDSPAWLDLKPSARAVYQQLLKRYNGRNNGTIAASVRALGEECRMSKDSVTPALEELISHGFVEVTREAAFTQKHKRAREFRLTAEKCDLTGEPPTRIWKIWTKVTPEKERPEPINQTENA